MAAGSVALVLLLLVAALARDAGDSDVEVAAGGNLPSLPDLLPFVAVAGMVVLGAAVVGAIMSGTLREALSWSPVRPLLLALALVLSVWLLSVLPFDERPTEGTGAPAEETVEETVTEAGDWLPSGPVLLVAVVVAAVGGVLVARFLRATGDGVAGGDDGGDEEEGAGGARARLVAGLDEVIEDLSTEPDPRRAVLRAWARLEELLGEHRLPRRPAEAPTTYVGRILERLDTSRPAVEALTARFQRAMFSPHPIDRADQSAAIDALIAVRDDLEARV